MENPNNEPRFVKKTCLLNVILGAESELFECVGPNGQTLLLTDSREEFIDFLRK